MIENRVDIFLYIVRYNKLIKKRLRWLNKPYYSLAIFCWLNLGESKCPEKLSELQIKCYR